MTALLDRVFGALLLLYPRRFRETYGAAMRRDFAQTIRARRDAIAALGYAARALVDVVAAGADERTSDLRRDVVAAMRTLRRAPAFALVVVGTLALAIGANATAFGVLRAVVLAPLPYPHAEALVRLGGLMDGKTFSLSLPDAADLASEASSFVAFAAYTPTDRVTLSGRGDERIVRSSLVTSDLFTVFGARPVLGRFFTPEDARPNATAAVISEALWRSQFAADPHAIGSAFFLDERPARIVGIAPAAFSVEGVTASQADVWQVVSERRGSAAFSRGAHYFDAIARLRDGSSLDRARSDLETVFSRLRIRYPADDRRFGVTATGLLDAVAGDVRPSLVALFAAVAGVLLVACANVANLSLGRASVREREFSVRLALGAPRRRIVAQVLTETLLLVALGGALGITVAAAALRSIVALHPPGVPRLADATIDATTAAYVFVSCAFCTVAAGLAPALALARPDLVSVLKSAGRSGDATAGGRTRAVLVVAEIALALALVVSAGLVTRSYAALVGRPLGFDARDVRLVGPVVLTAKRYRTDASQAAFYERTLRHARAIPGADDVAWAFTAPFTGFRFNLEFGIVGHPAAPGSEPSALTNAVTGGYFAALRVPLRAGRVFDERDRRGAPLVAVVNAALERRFFPGRSALGARITWGSSGPSGKPLPPRTIVGVVGDTRTTYATPEGATIYLPIVQETIVPAFLMTRSHDPAIGRALASAIASEDPRLPAPDAFALSDRLARDAAHARTTMIALASLATVALVLALAGIYAVVSYGVTQRTQEFGVRLALGAAPARIGREVVMRAMRVATVGVACGVMLAALAANALAAQLFDVVPLDGATFAVVVSLIALATLAAAYLPARRATRVDPVVALRYD